MRFVLRIAMLAVFAASVQACGVRTFEWREEVRLSSGETIHVQRSATLALQGEWATAQYRRVVQMRVELPGVDDSFVTNAGWPLAVDRIDGHWWVAVPVRGYDQCAAYDFPAESFVAFTLDASGWSLRSAADTPEQLTANLGQPSSYELENTYERRTFGWDEKYRNGIAPKLVDLIDEWQRERDSCISIRPPPDPAREASIVAYERLAPADRLAIVESVSSDLAPQERRRSKLLSNCEALVEGVDAYDVTDELGRRLDGYRIDFVGSPPSRPVRAFLPVRTLVPGSMFLTGVACEGERVLAVVRGGSEWDRLGVVEYDRNATLVGAWSFKLEGSRSWFAGEAAIVNALEDRGDFFAAIFVSDYGVVGIRVRLPKSGPTIAPPAPLVPPRR